MKRLRGYLAAMAAAAILVGADAAAPTSADALGRRYLYEWLGPQEGMCWATRCCYWQISCERICCGITRPT